jgi:hypothetical protein
MKNNGLYRMCKNAAATALLGLLAACHNGPKTYDACTLQASRDAKNDRQFQAMSQACKEKFKARYQ